MKLDPEQRSNWVVDRRDEPDINRLIAMLSGQVNSLGDVWKHSIGGHLLGWDKPPDRPSFGTPLKDRRPGDLQNQLGYDDTFEPQIREYNKPLKKLGE